MAIATYADFKDRMGQLTPMHFAKINLAATVAINRFYDAWLLTAGAGATPSTAVALDSTVAGAVNEFTRCKTDSILARSSVNSSSSFSNVMLIDRLSHQGGLSATVTTEQTTNLPTAALTRYTSGAGVMIALSLYATIGSTTATATVRYTNQAGTANQNSKAVLITAAGTTTGRFIIVPLADGDTGVRSVQGVTLSGSTGTAGNFGVVLFKPLAYLNPSFAGLEAYGTNNFNALLGGGCQFETIDPAACLSLLVNAGGSITVAGALNFMDVT